MNDLSHLTRGAWIEMQLAYSTLERSGCRTSHEVRGLKFNRANGYEKESVSHLTRGAWIEIYKWHGRAEEHQGRTSHEVRGLKCIQEIVPCVVSVVAPHTRCVD